MCTFYYHACAHLNSRDGRFFTRCICRYEIPHVTYHKFNTGISNELAFQHEDTVVSTNVCWSLQLKLYSCCLFVCSGIVTGLALAVGTNITASTVVTVVADDTAGVEAGLPVVIEADLLVVIVAGNTKLNACYELSFHKLTMLFVYCVSIFVRQFLSWDLWFLPWVRCGNLLDSLNRLWWVG